jgi:hypothetical protein
MKRAGISLLTGAVGGLLVAAAVGIPHLEGAASASSLISNAFSFWSLFFGSFAALAVAGLTFAVLNRGEPQRSRWGRWFAGLVLVVFATGLIWWIVAWGTPLTSQEGAWMYSLAAFVVVAAVLVVRKRRPNLWDEPPG